MKRILLTILIAAGAAQAQDLSQAQLDTLVDLSLEYAQAGSAIELAMHTQLDELAKELERDGRLDSEKNAKQAAKNTNAILKEIGGLYGDYIHTKVNFLLEAKNTLTPEQKMRMLTQLQPQNSLTYESIEFIQPDIFDLPIGLDYNQVKKLINLEAHLLIDEVKIERDAELILLDLEAIILTDGVSNPKAVDQLILKLSDLAAKAIDNRIDYFIEAKDVLTLDQKRILASLLGLD